MTAVFSGLVDFIGGHPLLAILVVFLVAAGEAIFLVGLFMPSTLVLVGVGTLIGMRQLPFWPILIASSLGATAGNSLSYWIGHIYTDRLRTVWPFSRYRALVDYGEQFFLRHGGKSIFVSRFLPGVKAVVPIIAGMLGMGVVRFTVINARLGHRLVGSPYPPGNRPRPRYLDLRNRQSSTDCPGPHRSRSHLRHLVPDQGVHRLARARCGPPAQNFGEKAGRRARLRRFACCIAF